VEFTMAQVIPYFISWHLRPGKFYSVCDQGVTHCRYKRTNQSHPHNRNAYSILPPSDSAACIFTSISTHSTIKMLFCLCIMTYITFAQALIRSVDKYCSISDAPLARMQCVLADKYRNNMGGVYVRPLRRVYTNIPTTICESFTETEGD